jgi:hypothetical protein
MELKDIARGVPEEIWTVFEPILPPVVWCGNGRPPKGNREVSAQPNHPWREW